MADITNAQTIKFCNERLRPAADRLISAIRTLEQMRAEYVAKGIGALVAGSGELQASTVADGSATDGRTPLTGYDVDLASNSSATIIAWLAGDGAAHVAALEKPTVNCQPVF